MAMKIVIHAIPSTTFQYCQFSATCIITVCLVHWQKVEGRVASDQELKLTELLRYYLRDIQAAKVGSPSTAVEVHSWKSIFLSHVRNYNSLMGVVVVVMWHLVHFTPETWGPFYKTKMGD